MSSEKEKYIYQGFISPCGYCPGLHYNLDEAIIASEYAMRIYPKIGYWYNIYNINEKTILASGRIEDEPPKIFTKVHPKRKITKSSLLTGNLVTSGGKTESDYRLWY